MINMFIFLKEQHFFLILKWKTFKYIQQRAIILLLMLTLSKVCNSNIFNFVISNLQKWINIKSRKGMLLSNPWQKL